MARAVRNGYAAPVTLLAILAVHLVMKGVSIYKVSHWLGHQSVNTTMIYAHLAPQDDEINKL